MLTPAGFGQTYLQNPYYFMFASLAKPEDDVELHWMKVFPFSHASIFESSLLYTITKVFNSPTSTCMLTFMLPGWENTLHDRLRRLIFISSQGL